MTEVIIRRVRPTDRDWLVDAHDRLYTRDEGFDASFAVLVAQILGAFFADHDPAAECGWIAEQDGQPLGSVFCVRLTADTAKLRLFLLLPEARGQGLGRRLLQTCMGFAQARDYSTMQLWTHESHRAACALYAASGWTLISSTPVQSFGQTLVEQSWTYRF